MKRLGVKSLLSIILVVSLLVPTIVAASNNSNVSIKYVYFEDASGNMVFVDYEDAIKQGVDGDLILYNAIKEYVGDAEEKGRAIFIETSNGKILDYKKALIDNLFQLKDILGKAEYEIEGPIEYSHVLKVIDGEARIVPVEEEDEDVVYIVEIFPVEGITVEIGTPENEAISKLPKTTKIVDSEGRRHIVFLSWRIEEYNPDVEGDYTAIATFQLPEGIENKNKLELIVTTTVTVEKAAEEEEGFPEEVDTVFVGESDITKKTYANINIKEEYVERVKGVYVDNKLAMQIEDAPYQWRMEVEEGTSVEDLKGRIRVELEDAPPVDDPEDPEEPEEEPHIIASYHPSIIPNFGFVTVEVENLQDAAMFSVVYQLADNEDGTANIRETDKANIGEQVGLIFYKPDLYDTIDIKIFDAEENLIYTFQDVRPQIIN